MIDRLLRMVRGPDPVEDLISAYLDATSDTELEGVEERLRAAGVDVDELRTVRETAQLLRSIGTVEAPRSFALTPETLADQGYSEAEADKILNPRAIRGRLRLRNAAVYVPLAIAAVALAGVALLTIGDLSEYVTDRFESDEAGLSDAPGEPGVPEESAAFADTAAQVIEVEKEVIVTVVVEKAVEVAGETVIQTVEVEKIVEVEKVVEREVVVEKKVPVTVVVEKEVVVEREVVVEMEKLVEVEKEVEVVKEVEILPTPAPARAEAAAEAMMTDDFADEEETPTPIPEEVPCAIAPTATPTPTGSPSASTTPEPTATMSPIPICTPTPTPSPTPTSTPTPTR
ncbi:MAG: hypothetical protein F4Y88_06905 [Chloroflexi bacterium]|nr:hypothetical protein [Chloroflexota bacterium]